MFRITRPLFKQPLNQAARKSMDAMDTVRRKVEEKRRQKEDRIEEDADKITDRLVLEAYKELAEERRARDMGMSVEALRHQEGKGAKPRVRNTYGRDNDDFDRGDNVHINF